MTTLIGMQVAHGKEGIILASDVSATRTEWRPQGDVAYRHQIKTEAQKIYVDKDREFAVAMAGVFDTPFMKFLGDLLDRKIDIKKAIEEGFFNELLRLNLSRWEGRTPDNEYCNGIILATRFDTPKLYTCYPLGRLEDRTWTSIGSGSEFALKYINKQGLVIPGRVNLNKGIETVANALEEACQDPYTGGIDLVVITQEGIQEYSQEIKTSMENAKKKKINEIISRYS